MSYEEKRVQLVKKLKFERRIISEKVEKAFLEIPREEFVPPYLKNQAYFDTPLEIGEEQTISAPHMVAIMCEELLLSENMKILEIGSGSGYHAAIVSKIIGPKGHVYTVERIKSLAEQAKKNLKKIGIKNVTVKHADGSTGLPDHAPYDRIYVTCAAPKIPPPLIQQLKEDGVLLIPVGDRFCELKRIRKKNDKLIQENLGGCVFVPLIGKHGL